MTPTWEDSLHRINRSLYRATIARRALLLLRGVIIGMFLTSLWAIIIPGENMVGAAFFLIGFGLSIVSRRWLWQKPVRLADLRVAIDIDHPESTLPSGDPKWRELAKDKAMQTRQKMRAVLISDLRSLIVPAALCSIAFAIGQPTWRGLTDDVDQLLARLTRGVYLTIRHGDVNAAPETTSPAAAHKRFKLSPSDPLTLHVSQENLLDLIAVGYTTTTRPSAVEWRRAKPDGSWEILQSFQFSPAMQVAAQARQPEELLTFSAPQSLALFLPAVDTERPVATIEVDRTIGPAVTLALQAPPKDMWPDDMAIPLLINAEGRDPIAKVEVHIQVGTFATRELVSRVMDDQRLSVSLPYSFLPEPYLQEDIVEITITAEATDRAHPIAHVGVSSPLVFKVASSYGRYQQTLTVLREVRDQVDSVVGGSRKNLTPELTTSMKIAQEDAATSPYFDGLDRVRIEQFGRIAERLTQEPYTPADLSAFSQGINDFLFEHEAIDDRERDRDFFVAVRSFARLIEAKIDNKPEQISRTQTQLRKYLDTRHIRWESRVKRLPIDMAPKDWPTIKGKPFHGQITALSSTASAGNVSGSLEALGKVVAQYKTWIESLEAQEDKAHARDEQKRQETLQKAENALRALQKRQGVISQRLDRAAERDTAPLQSEWPETSTLQGGIAQDTESIQGQLQAMSPRAAERIELAVTAMQRTLATGKAGDFVTAESNADLAGRLLRQAESAAQESQRDQKQRQRRRRVSGDRYYGQHVESGDIQTKHEYQVDKRYREDILDDVQKSLSPNEDDRRVQDRFIRQIVR